MESILSPTGQPTLATASPSMHPTVNDYLTTITEQPSTTPTNIWATSVWYDEKIDKIWVIGGDTCGNGACDTDNVYTFDMKDLCFDVYSYPDIATDIWHESNGIVVLNRTAYVIGSSLQRIYYYDFDTYATGTFVNYPETGNYMCMTADYTDNI